MHTGILAQENIKTKIKPEKIYGVDFHHVLYV